ncbi:hypothetical protein BKK81_09520 [Cupriavidus sp. USMAHM13]|uniref:VOC family protein n=1 Tax=Cupriavidus sp. USMAHM13 TaxID=1389192 RepID=UPI0008A7016B|nr:VOC family protein [Cupriavidus sp. USMAHM13]AOY99478.1 hypothetical protein BKK81_09520 [Cupriavidus sp. USMAHM13]
MQLLTRIEVDDLAQAAAFYRDGLGLHAGAWRPGARAVMLHAGGGQPAQIVLLELPQRAMRRSIPARVDWLVPELEPAIERALEAGADLEDWPQECGAGRQAVLLDPFGNALRFLQWPGLPETLCDRADTGTPATAVAPGAGLLAAPQARQAGSPRKARSPAG